jgi:hypothetical protein
VFPFQQGQYNLATRPKILPIPRPVSNSDFDEICESFKISPKKNRRFLRAVVDGATAGVAEFVTQQKLQPHRRDDRKLVADSVLALRKVRQCLDRLGPEGKEALREIDDFLSPLVSARWLHQQFPNDSLAPKIAGLAADFEDRSLDQRRLFIWNRPSLAINAVLAELGQGLNAMLSRLKTGPGAKGGRKPAIDRHLMILSLVRAWNRIGKKISTGPKSEFVQFVEAVLVATGWPERGVTDAVADAVRDWRNRTQKKVR